MWLKDRLRLILQQPLKVLRLHYREESDIYMNSILTAIKKVGLTKRCKIKKYFFRLRHQDLSILHSSPPNTVEERRSQRQRC